MAMKITGDRVRGLVRLRKRSTSDPSWFVDSATRSTPFRLTQRWSATNHGDIDLVVLGDIDSILGELHAPRVPQGLLDGRRD
jgi:hypothetical protein